MTMPGFSAEASLYRRGIDSRATSAGGERAGDAQVTPQFIGRGIMCGALLAAVVAGQEEFLFLVPYYCGVGLA